LEDKVDEEESLIKLRVIWALFLKVDLENDKRTKRLNRAHIEAMETLKDIERKANENNHAALKEAEFWLIIVWVMV
jgi:hypothetical protein